MPTGKVVGSNPTLPTSLFFTSRRCGGKGKRTGWEQKQVTRLPRAREVGVEDRCKILKKYN
ncbi:MAG: hypothetical protein ACTSPI_16615 [Candidatus Heimdallarchaeaceae archaeon]